MALGLALIAAIGSVRPELVERRLSEMEELCERFDFTSVETGFFPLRARNHVRLRLRAMSAADAMVLDHADADALRLGGGQLLDLALVRADLGVARPHDDRFDLFRPCAGFHHHEHGGQYN